MDESRKQFEEWFKNKYHVSSDVMKIMHIKVEIAWEAWQASRAAIEIELPVWFVSDAIAVYDRDDIDESIRAAGIKVKELA
ncbi:TPA: hypothetical protein ACHGE5_001271 [Escherichia coli]|jgi:hypothetical protein|uniref:hypothetical protein n=1 Tax=Escherichia coli TaxID=562 RepID=UPI0010CB884E|nr:hypothetical protein [Escherichia coli]EEW6403057.1 hypothetical protein [Escherichia coli]EJG2764073.1 hypothetical protein [Escherichia coli]EMB5522330.1 hypothetical protein [Escherichia coli]GDA98842.1 hypothetical protein HmCmsJML133_00133 [Escherichia coli]HAX5299589.1 hypothetical protein [Escherichia coli]